MANLGLWDVKAEEVGGGRRFQVLRAGDTVSFGELFRLLEDDPGFVSWYTSLLASSEFASFFWEHPPLSTATYGDAAEFVLIDAPSLTGLRPDPEPFRSRFERHQGEDVAIFPNLGGDAVLVVPLPIGPAGAYVDLAAFVRRAPAAQIESLWRDTAQVVRGNLGTEPKWLSTAGMGVSWLHVRFDSRPKYYRFGPYKA